MFLSGDHPLAFIIKGFWHIDRVYNGRDLLECIDGLQGIENKLQHPGPDSLGKLSVDLNVLNTKISKVRTCVQYIKASMDTVSAMMGAYRHGDDIFRRIIQDWQVLESDIISLQKRSEQRLLDIGSVQQRINISLSVVGLYAHLSIALVV